MKIVIDINEKNYKSVMLTQNRPIGQRLPYGLSEAIKNGIPLSKGHGRLIDADELIKQLEATANIEWNMQVGSSKGLEDAIDIVGASPTIIKADNVESEE